MNAAANFAGIGCETSILQSRSKQLNCGAGCQDLAKNSASRFQYNSFDKQLLIPHSLPFHERAAMSKTRISSGMGWGEEKRKGGIFSCRVNNWKQETLVFISLEFSC